MRRTMPKKTPVRQTSYVLISIAVAIWPIRTLWVALSDTMAFSNFSLMVGSILQISARTTISIEGKDAFGNSLHITESALTQCLYPEHVSWQQTVWLPPLLHG